jgi:hypothetical protein
MKAQNRNQESLGRLIANRECQVALKQSEEEEKTLRKKVILISGAAGVSARVCEELSEAEENSV